MDETQVTRRALRFLLREYVEGHGLYPTREVADEDGARPDKIIVVLRDDLEADEIESLAPEHLHVHSVESKVARSYLIGPDHTGVAQARDYFGHYRWLAVPVNADLDEDEWDELAEECRAHGVGLLAIGHKDADVLVEAELNDGDHFVRYARWEEMLEEFARGHDLPFDLYDDDEDESG
jgi:hypothetical protein